MKFTTSKRIVSLSCIAAMALSSTAAFAADIPDADKASTSTASTFDYTGKVNAGTIKVTMGAADYVYVNPYKIEVAVFDPDPDTDDDETTSTETVISPTRFIKNESDVGLKVSVLPKATASSAVTIVNSTQIAAATDKSVAINFEIQNVDNDSADADWASPKAVALSAEAPESATETIVLGKGDTTPTYAAFRLHGTAVEEPKVEGVASPWTESDTVSASIAFTFTPTNEGSTTGDGSGNGDSQPEAAKVVIAAATTSGGTPDSNIDLTSWDGSTTVYLVLAMSDGSTLDEAYTDGTYEVSWSSSDSTTVRATSGTGKLTAVKDGTVTITATVIDADSGDEIATYETTVTTEGV